MSLKDTLFSVKQTINCGGHVIDLRQPKIMGILNITPDSFYDGGRYYSESAILDRVNAMISEGADIIDIGGYSSRPGAEEISTAEEEKRVRLAMDTIRRHHSSFILSIDTFRSDIASMAVKEYAAAIINDISAGTLDSKMMRTASSLKVPFLMMHMKGTPKTMQIDPQYDNPISEIIAYFSERLAAAREAGINDIIIDPGFGFGKTVEHNYSILRDLNLLTLLGCPVAAGLSRKSMVYKPLGLVSENALTGTTAVHVLALLNGASILRVHDVKEAVQTARIVGLYRNA